MERRRDPHQRRGRPTPRRLFPCAVISLALTASSCGGEPSTSTPATEPAKVDVSDGAVVFEDDFDGDALDADNWVTCYWWTEDGGCTNLGTGELQWYRPDNVTVRDGVLRLEARREIAEGFEGRRFEYTSGLVSTGRIGDPDESRPRFEMLYGTLEIRARVVGGAGMWSALWMLPIDQESRPEIDIIEVLGDSSTTSRYHLHYVDNHGERRSLGQNREGLELAGEWRTYRIDWLPESLTFSVDGGQEWTVRDPVAIPREPMYLLMNLAVGGDWAGPPAAEAEFPAALEVDWVRVRSIDP